MNVVSLPPLIEFQRLQRLREAVLGSEIKRPSSMVATEDWIADIDARLADLEKSLPPTRKDSNPQD
jgi:hypothetical protein